MTLAFDNRVVQVGLEIDGQMHVFEGLDIRASGTKYMSALHSTCELRISNIAREMRQKILTQSSPMMRTGIRPMRMTLDIGRESSGVFRLFDGVVFHGGITQPPDIGIMLYSLTNNFLKTQTIGVSFDVAVDLRVIAQRVADTCGLKLNYNCKPRSVDNYTFTGSPDKQIQKLNQMGNVVAFVDNDELVVIESNTAREGDTRIVNLFTGMVGIPQTTTTGVNVMVMADNTIKVGCRIRVESIQNPSANGEYIVMKMNYDIASRDEPFWYTLECKSPQLYTGGTL